MSPRLAIAVAATLLATTASTGPPASPPAAPPVATAPEPLERSTALMGTDVTILILSTDPDGANAAIDAAFAEIARIEAMMTDWNDTSEVAAVNRGAGGPPVSVSPELAGLLAESQSISELTDGAFDVTWKGVGRLWDFQATPPRAPTDDAIAAALPLVDYRALRVDRAAGTVALDKRGMQIGLGGIAKGYAVDRATAVIRARGFKNFVVNAGGDLFASGRNGKKLWQAAIEKPRDKERTMALLPAANLAVVTSGDYERFFVVDGVRYSHILDPRTGRPASGCESVTILAPTAARADALATGVFVLGPERGLALVESLPDVQAVIVDASGELHVSTGLAGR